MYGRAHVAVAAVLVWAVLAGAALARTPLPRRDPARSVYDEAGVIRPEHRAQMERLHAELFQKTGVAQVVLTVPRLEDETIEELAVRVGQDWGVGRKGEDRGLVVALSVEDRRIFVATGYGVEGYLPDGRVGGLIDEHALPHLARNDFSQGLLRLSQALAQASAAEYGAMLDGAPPVAERPGPTGGCGAAGVMFFLVLFIILVLRNPALLFLLPLAGGRRGAGFGGGGGFGGFGGGGFGGGGAGRGF